MSKGRGDRLKLLAIGMLTLTPLPLLAQANTASDRSIAIGRNGDHSPVTIIESPRTPDRYLQHLDVEMHHIIAQLAIFNYKTNPKRRNVAAASTTHHSTQASRPTVSSPTPSKTTTIEKMDGEYISATQISAIYDRAQDDLSHGRLQSFEENLKKGCNLHDDTACDQLSEEYITGKHLKISLFNACDSLKKSKSYEAKYLVRNCNSKVSKDI